MGNWRTVRIEGTMDPTEVRPLKALLLYDYQSNPDVEFSCLGWGTQASLCGLNEWPAAKIDAIGNLHERDYTVDDVAEALRACLAVAPSLRVFIDCGDDYESDECVATVAIDEDGSTVAVLPPRIEKLPEIPDGQMMANFLKATLR